MTIEQQKAALKLKAQARLRLKSQGGPTVGSGEQGDFGALIHGFDNFAKTVGQGLSGLGELAGIDTVREYGDSVVAANDADLKRRGFVGNPEADGIIKNLGEGDYANAARSLKQSALSSGPSIAVGAAASFGAAALTGGLSIPAQIAAATATGAATTLGVIQAVGEIKQEAIDKGVESKTGLGDLATAIGSAAVELVPGGGKLGRIGLGIVKEGVQEGVQEGLVVANTAVKGGEYEPAEVAQRLGDAAITGGVVSKGMEVSGRAVKGAANAVSSGVSAIIPSRTDPGTYTSEDADLAQLLKDLTDNQPEKLGNVSTTESGIGAQSIAKAALKSLRAEQVEIASRMRKLAKKRGFEEASIDLKKIVAEGGLATSANTEFSLEKLDKAFAGEPDLARLKRVHRMLSKVQGFTQASNDLGGISGNLTRYIDPTDGRNSGITKGVSLHTGGIIGAGIAVNRIARGVDNLTNRRSRIKRYVDSVDKSGVKSSPINGETSTDKLDKLTKIASEAVLAERNRVLSEKKMTGAKAALNQSKAALNQSKAQEESEAQALLFKQNAQATSEMFETGVVPQSTDDFKYFEPYEMWETQTGLKPEDTVNVLEQLEREGLAAKGSAQKYSENIRGFKSDDSTYNLQRLVQQRGNPGYMPKSKSKPVPDEILKKLAASTVKPQTTRGKYKALEGSRRAQNVVVAIENARSSLRPKTYQALFALKDAVDRPDMNRDDREALIRGTIGNLFPTAGQRDHWISEFYPLVTIGNDERIFKKAEVETEAEAEKAFEEKVAKVKKTTPKKAKKSADEVAKPAQLELDPVPVETKADVAIEKLNNPSKVIEPEEEVAESTKVVQATEPMPRAKATGKTGLEKSIQTRIQQFEDTVALAEAEGPALVAYVNELRKSKSTASRVEQMIYAFANDRLTANMLIDAYGEQYNIPYDAAAKQVMDTVDTWIASGAVKVFSAKGASKLIVDGEYQKDGDTSLDVIQIELIDQGMKNALEIAKAVRTVERMINPNEPEWEYSTSVLQDGPNKALKDYDADQIDETFTPFLNFLNAMRAQKFSIHEGMLSQVENAITTGGKKKGMIAKVLKPLKKGKVDSSPLNTVAQMLWQFGQKDERAGTQFRMEWSAGRNLRIYSKNGLVHSQAGDMMKGMMRTDEKYKLGDVKSLQFMLHSFGNLLGNDKKSPETRRGTIFETGKIEALLEFAKDPFGQYVLTSSKGNEKGISKILDDGEGFFQVLNTAHEVSAMVDFAKKRNPKKALWPVDKLLQDPEVQSDLAANYETDFLVQLDASNNAYQIVGLTMGYADVLKSTGLMPRSNSDPDTQVGADIYMASAMAVVERIPELKALRLPPSAIRKIFKKPISTYVYAAALQSRKAAFENELDAYVNKDGDETTPIVGIGETAGLIQVPNQVIEGMKSGQGFVFRDDKHDPISNSSKKVFTAKRVVESEPGVFKIAVATTAGGKFTVGKKRFESEDMAISNTFEQDLYGRMSNELIQDFEGRYPQVKEYMKFFESVSGLVKARGESVVKVPTPDGMVLEYSFKEKDSFSAIPYQMGDRVVNIGVKTPETKITGRGLSAFATHQLDAYVLRETARRMQEVGVKSFNPIHDSYGFHPSDAAVGQEVTLQVMQELGNKEYNLFMDILLENNLLKSFQESGGVMPKREGITPYAAKDIPTAMS